MKDPRAWFALAGIATLFSCGLYVHGNGQALQNEAILRSINQFDECSTWFVEKYAFTSYLGIPNTAIDVRDAHEAVGKCREETVRGLEDTQLHAALSEEAIGFINDSMELYESELAIQVAATELLPKTLANVGVQYPSTENPLRAASILSLVAAAAFFWTGISRRSRRNGTATAAAAAVDQPQEPAYRIDTRIYEDEDDDIEEDAEDFEGDFDEFIAEDFEEDIDREALNERRAREREREREEYAAGMRASREREAERRAHARRERELDDERRAQDQRADRDRRSREADDKLRRQREGERQQREESARRRQAEDRQRDEERRARAAQRREAAEYAQREREHEIVFAMKGGGFHTVSAGSASGARMAAEARLRSSSNVSGYVIRNKNGKVVGSG